MSPHLADPRRGTRPPADPAAAASIQRPVVPVVASPPPPAPTNPPLAQLAISVPPVTNEPPLGVHAPTGRLLRCQLVNTIDSSSIDTPIIALVAADLWHGGELVVPTGTEPNVWHPDEVAPYVLGRYVDPRDPNMVHESHLVYRREKSSRPNLTPPAVVVLPSSEVAGPSAAHVLQFYRDALTAELNAQRTTSEQIIEQSRQLQQSVGTLNEQVQSLRQSVEEGARLRSQWQDITGRVDQLERRLREAQAPAETPQSNASGGWFRR